MRVIRARLALLAMLTPTMAWIGCVALKDDGLPSTVPTAEAGSDAAEDLSFGLEVGSTDGAPGEAATEAGPVAGLWPNAIPACWASEADEAAFLSPVDSQAHWIHDCVESNWGHEANLRFGTWPGCPTSGTGVNAKVLILPAEAGVDDDAAADAGDAGSSLAEWGGQVDGMGVATGGTPTEPARISFLPLEPDGVDDIPRERTLCDTNRIFSRVLGLADDPAAQPFGATYCGDVSDPTGNRLSPLQILRVRNAYGPKPPGSVVGFDGRCLTASSTMPGSIVWTDDCVPQASGVAGADQRWTYDPWAGVLSLVESGLTLDSQGAAQATQPVVNTPIAGSPNQVWLPSAEALRGIGGTCLDFQSFGANGLRAVLWPCGRSIATQRVDFGPNASIQATSPPADAGATCLAITGGTDVGPAACDGTPAQQWRLAPGGAIQSLGAPGSCLAAVIDEQDAAVGLEDGLALQVAPCSGALQQQFDIFGVLLASSMCLDVAGLTRADQATIWTWACAATDGLLGGENDWWDVTW